MNDDGIPDYQNYTLAALHEVLEHVNREKYPDRYAAVKKELRRRELAAMNAIAMSPATRAVSAPPPRASSEGLNWTGRCARFFRRICERARSYRTA
jgi:hypothetical protein